jgi:glutamate-ammonia-ligase adenylyltransferase
MTTHKKQLKLSKDFIEKLFQISAGYFPEQDFDKLITLFETEAASRYFTYSSESNLLRIISGMYDKVSFLHDCIKYPHYVEILLAISVNSNYLTDIIVRNPEYFYRIINPSHLNVKLEEEKFSKSVKETTGVYKTFSAKLNALRTLKRRETLRIGLKDILGTTSLKETAEELSTLAAGITDELFSICYSEILLKYELENLNRQYCIIGLGKLGGKELNYSSDIDLIIFFDEDAPVTKNKVFSEILIEAVRLFTENATTITSSGYIYRVDFRLRPDGRYSPLAGTIGEYINYYETRGEDWERQMLIKAGFIGGSKELYDKLMGYLTHFVYPINFSIPPTEQIKKLKQNIEKHLGEEENIKLIPGGIRDVEFSVQALQLINGGRISSIRIGNTLDAISLLQNEKLLTKTEAQILTEAYTLYRKIEHYLQLMNDTQTHTIPSSGEILEKMRAYLGFINTESFKNHLKKERQKVLKIFISILGEETKPKKDLMQEIDFANKARAEQDFMFLREGKSLFVQKKFDQKSINAFQEIEPELRKYLKYSLQPDVVLQNFARVIKEGGFPSIWYNEFLDKKFFKSFLTLCEFSQKTIYLFADDKNLRENFLTKKVFENITKENMASFNTRKLLYILSSQFTLNKIKGLKVSQTLSEFFRIKIGEITDRIFEEASVNYKYFIAALGSFGSGEMTFASDMDLIFVTDDIDPASGIQKNFQTLLLKLKDEFKPHEVDCRLRPEGKSSLLVWDLKGYEKYLNTRARTWEFQAFCKLNYVCGDEVLFKRFIRIIQDRISTEDKQKLKKEILEMRKKTYPLAAGRGRGESFNIKKSPGGLSDINFLLEYLMLSNPVLFKKSRGSGVLKTIAGAVNLNKSLKEIESLQENYAFLKKLEMTNQCIFNSTTSSLPSDTFKYKLVTVRMGFKEPDKFRKHLSEIIKTNNSLFNKYLTHKN